MKRLVWTGILLIGGGAYLVLSGGQPAVSGSETGKESPSPSVLQSQSESPLAYLHNQRLVGGNSSDSSVSVQGEVVDTVRNSPFKQMKESLPEPQLSGDAALVMDLKSDQMLYQKNAYKKHNIASLTKLMTAMVVLDEYSYGEAKELSMSQSAFQAYGGNYIRPDEQLTVEELLHAALMASSNDASALLAQYFGGEDGEVGFVRKMNQKASELNLYKTQFANAHGLNAPDKQQYSTAYDVMKMGEVAFNTYPTLQNILGVEETTLTTDAGREIPVNNINKLLGKLKTKGGKTGYTEKAGETFFTVASIKEREVGVVVLGSQINRRFQDTRTLIEWTREHYNRR